MNNNFIQYNQINIDDKSNNKIIYNNDINICLSECETNDNCQGIAITKPICSKNKSLLECINSFTNIDIFNIIPENLYKHKCKFLSNIVNNEQIHHSEENKSLIKNRYINMLDSKIDTSKYYYLKINNKYLSIINKHANIFLTTNDSIDKASLFKFNHDGKIIELKTSKCLQTNGKHIILTDCNMNNDIQKFIYENKFNSIRPCSDDALCLSEINDQYGVNIKIKECKYVPAQNVQIEKTSETLKIREIEEQNFENFKSFRKQIENKLDNVNYCSNPLYKSVVLIILICILIYFIWFVTRKKYSDDLNISDLVSTPFDKPN